MQARQKASQATQISRWVANLKDESEVKEFYKLLEAAKHNAVIRRLVEIIEEDLERLAKAALKNTNYDSPSWAYAQADSIGHQRALNNIRALLKGLNT